MPVQTVTPPLHVPGAQIQRHHEGHGHGPDVGLTSGVHALGGDMTDWGLRSGDGAACAELEYQAGVRQEAGIVTEDRVITLETTGSLTAVGRGRAHRVEAALGR